MPKPQGQSGGINCLHTFDMTKDDKKDILVGRDDGTIQVYRCGAVRCCAVRAL